jgi:hypothetical protein
VIDSLNDWAHGSAIEASPAWASASGFGLYLVVNGYVIDSSPSQLRDFSVYPHTFPFTCELVRAASEDALVITYEAAESNDGLTLYTSPTCASDQQITPRVRTVFANPASNEVSQQTFTPGFTVPAGTALYAKGRGWVSGYVPS